LSVVPQEENVFLGSPILPIGVVAVDPQFRLGWDGPSAFSGIFLLSLLQKYGVNGDKVGVNRFE
jgi:hypothetical protein